MQTLVVRAVAGALEHTPILIYGEIWSSREKSGRTWILVGRGYFAAHTRVRAAGPYAPGVCLDTTLDACESGRARLRYARENHDLGSMF